MIAIACLYVTLKQNLVEETTLESTLALLYGAQNDDNDEEQMDVDCLRQCVEEIEELMRRSELIKVVKNGGEQKMEDEDDQDEVEVEEEKEMRKLKVVGSNDDLRCQNPINVS